MKIEFTNYKEAKKAAKEFAKKLNSERMINPRYRVGSGEYKFKYEYVVIPSINANPLVAEYCKEDGQFRAIQTFFYS